MNKLNHFKDQHNVPKWIKLGIWNVVTLHAETFKHLGIFGSSHAKTAITGVLALIHLPYGQ